MTAKCAGSLAILGSHRKQTVRPHRGVAAKNISVWQCQLELWLHAQLPSISGKSPLAGAIRYALARTVRLRPYLDYGILELANNTAERAMWSVAIGRKTYPFVGAQTGGKAAAIAYSLIETAKLNGVVPPVWLADTLARIPYYRTNSIDHLLPWKTAS